MEGLSFPYQIVEVGKRPEAPKPKIEELPEQPAAQTEQPKPAEKKTEKKQEKKSEKKAEKK